MRWGSWKPPEEDRDPAVGHHRHLHVEHDDVEAESASSELWLAVLPVEEAVHVEDPAADHRASSGCSDEAMSDPVAGPPEGETSSGSESGDNNQVAGEHRGRGRRSGRGRSRRRRIRRGGLSVLTVVGAAAAAVLLVLVASWRRRQRRPAAGS